MNRVKAEFFDSQAQAPWAAEEYGELERPKIARLVREAELASGQAILEPGCGTGRLSRVLAEVVGGRGLVAALDISAAMLEACRARVAAFPQVRVRHASLEEFSAPSAGFDRIICHQVFPHFDDQEAALARMAAMLKPGGVLLVAHFISAEEINDMHRKAGTVVEHDLLPGDVEMAAMIAEAGFRLESLRDDELGYLLKARLPTS